VALANATTFGARAIEHAGVWALYARGSDSAFMNCSESCLAQPCLAPFSSSTSQPSPFVGVSIFWVSCSTYSPLQVPSPSPPNSTCRVRQEARGRLDSERPSRRQQTRAPSKRPVSRSSRLLRKLPRPLQASMSQALAISGHQLVLQRLCRGCLCSTSEPAVSCAFIALTVEPTRG
jgi:hypothetical protein